MINVQMISILLNPKSLKSTTLNLLVTITCSKTASTVVQKGSLFETDLTFEPNTIDNLNLQVESDLSHMCLINKVSAES